MIKYIKNINKLFIYNELEGLKGGYQETNKESGESSKEELSKGFIQKIADILETTELTEEEIKKIEKASQEELEMHKKEVKDKLFKHIRDIIVTNIAKNLIKQAKKENGKVELDGGFQIDKEGFAPDTWFDKDTFFTKKTSDLLSKKGYKLGEHNFNYIHNSEIIEKIYNIDKTVLQDSLLKTVENDIKIKNNTDKLFKQANLLVEELNKKGLKASMVSIGEGGKVLKVGENKYIDIMDGNYDKLLNDPKYGADFIFKNVNNINDNYEIEGI